jgi:hypothetical protein
MVGSDHTRLSYDQTVPKALVHVWAVAEVFITDSVRLGPNDFLLGVQLPRAHILWSDHGLPDHDPLITIEIVRQSAFLIVHHYFGVPIDSKMVLERVDIRIEDLVAFQDNRLSPPEGIVRAYVFDKQERDGMLSSVSIEAELTIGGHVAMRATGRMHMLPRAEYRLLRAHSRARKTFEGNEPVADPQPVPALVVGRADERNVVIQDAAALPGEQFRYSLLVNESHPAYFDHPHDHITGSLIVETCRQAAVATAHRAGAMPSPVATVTGCHVTFVEFAEIDALAQCSASVTDVSGDGVVSVELKLHQLGGILAEARLELTPVASVFRR